MPTTLRALALAATVLLAAPGTGTGHPAFPGGLDDVDGEPDSGRPEQSGRIRDKRAVHLRVSWFAAVDAARSTMIRGFTSGAHAPSASAAHGDVGRCVRRESALAPSITADRTAGAGAPMTTT